MYTQAHNLVHKGKKIPSSGLKSSSSDIPLDVHGGLHRPLVSQRVKHLHAAQMLTSIMAANRIDLP